jgi:hypothetical protein
MRLAQQRYNCQFSGAFLKSPNVFYIEQTGHLMKYSHKSSKRNEDTSFQHSLKNHLTRRGFDVFLYWVKSP